MKARNYKLNINTKFLIITISTILFICTSLVFFSVKAKRRELYIEVEKRALTEITSFSYDARLGVLTEDLYFLNHLVAGRLVKPEIIGIEIINYRGHLLTLTGYSNKNNLKLRETGDPSKDFGNYIFKTNLVSDNGETVFEFVAPIITDKYMDTKMNRIRGDLGVFFINPFGDALTIGFLKITISLDYVDKMVNKSLYISIFIIFIVGSIGVVGSSFFVKKITSSIETIAKVAEEISNGDLTKFVDIKSSDEVGAMANNFNKMTASLRRSIYGLGIFKTKLERKVALRTEDLRAALAEQSRLLHELEGANADLRDFAYVVSHDLKAPLRGIRTLSTWIVNDNIDSFNKAGREQMELLIGRASRMHQLIDGVLRYSRAGRTKDNIAEIDLNELLSSMIKLLPIPKNCEVRFEKNLPSIFCEKTRIEQLLQNLLTNAMKFVDKQKGVIIIDCKDCDDYWQISVADNGVGIEKKHFNRIFRMFQTLLPRDVSENTGVGLAVVKKIVEMYYGEVWVESREGIGTTFYFTLPKV